MNQTKIIDNFLTQKETNILWKMVQKEWFGRKESRSKDFVELWLDKNKLTAELQKMIDQENLNYNGISWWVHDSSIKRGHIDLSRGLPRHTDYDIVHFYKTGEKRHPEKTFIYYPFSYNNFSGGELVVYENNGNYQTIHHKKNRLIIINASLEHVILPFVGRRVSIAFSPWLEQPPGTLI